MFGGNPNMRINKPLQPHHIKQQLGTHNNRGLGGITAGKNAVQSPAQGANVNSTGGVPSVGSGVYVSPTDTGWVPPPGYDGPTPTAPYGPDWTVPENSNTGYPLVPPTLPRHPSYGTYLPPGMQPPLDPEGITRYGRVKEASYGKRIQHFDKMGMAYTAQAMLQRAAASAARSRAEHMQLLSKRDEREAQLARPHSGTNWLYGF